MGDFAVGQLVEDGDLSRLRSCTGRALGGTTQDVTIFNERGFDILQTMMNNIDWVGYAGVRDASSTSMPPRASDEPPLPPWQEMVELRYGVAQKWYVSSLSEPLIIQNAGTLLLVLKISWHMGKTVF